MAEYYRKTTGIKLLRYLVKRTGRTRAKGDDAGVSLTVGELKQAIREYDELFDFRNKVLKESGQKPHLKL